MFLPSSVQYLHISNFESRASVYEAKMKESAIPSSFSLFDGKGSSRDHDEVRMMHAAASRRERAEDDKSDVAALTSR